MAIIVRKNLVSPAKYAIKCPYPMNAEYITVHNTANDASAQGEINYMVGNSALTGYHYAVDATQVVQGIPESRNAWHAGDGKYGDGNRKSIGVEICYSKSGGQRYHDAEALTAKFIAQLLHERKWGVDRVKTHKHWTQIGVAKGYSRSVKNCPHRILDENRWSSFIAQVQKELNALKTVIPVSNPVSGDTYTVVKGDTLSHIALRYKVTVGALKTANGLKTDVIQIGQQLKIPSSATAPVPSTKPSAPAPTTTVHTVKRGETLSHIAVRYRVSVAELKRLNGLRSDVIQIGQKIKVTGSAAKKPTVHTVEKGDTLWDLARAYGTTVANLKSWNGLKSDVLEIGQKLHLKATAPKAKYHTVKRGDTFSEIAVKYKVSAATLRKLNPQVKNVHQISVGQKLRVA